jgi:hypothetical protein
MPSLRVPKWYLVVIGAVAVQRLGELSISRSNEAGIRGVRAASSTYPLMVLAHVGLVTLPVGRQKSLRPDQINFCPPTAVGLAQEEEEEEKPIPFSELE